jgi:spermidine/putrescine transport system substrate-binding protein
VPGSGLLRRVPAATVSALLVAACVGSPTGTVSSRALEIYTWSAYLPAEVIDGFRSAHPGLAVTVTTYDSNEAMLAGLAAQPGHCDIVIPSGYAVEILIDQKGLEPIDVSKDLGHFDNVLPAFRAPYFDPGGNPSRTGGKGVGPKYSVPFQWGTTGIAYDSSKTGLTFGTFADLADPSLNGKVGVLDDVRETLGMALIATARDKNDSDPDALDAAVAWLNGLGIGSVNSDDPEQDLLDGKVIAALVFNGNAAAAVKANPAMRFVLPEGGGIFFDNLAIPAGAPHRDAALAFIDYVLQGDVSARISRTYGYSTPNRAALDALATSDPAFADDPISNPPPETLLGLRLVKNVGPAGQARFEAAWDRVTR